MTRKRARPRRSKNEEDLQGPPPREAMLMRSDAELRAEEELAARGTVATPDQDQDVVDEIGDALGVPRSPNEEVRTSAEILDERDAHRWDQERP